MNPRSMNLFYRIYSRHNAYKAAWFVSATTVMLQFKFSPFGTLSTLLHHFRAYIRRYMHTYVCILLRYLFTSLTFLSALFRRWSKVFETNKANSFAYFLHWLGRVPLNVLQIDWPFSGKLSVCWSKYLNSLCFISSGNDHLVFYFI